MQVVNESEKKSTEASDKTLACASVKNGTLVLSVNTFKSRQNLGKFSIWIKIAKNIFNRECQFWKLNTSREGYDTKMRVDLDKLALPS